MIKLFESLPSVKRSDFDGQTSFVVIDIREGFPKLM